MFPSTEQLRPLVGAATAVADAEAQRATITWPAGPSIALSRMPDDQMGQHLSGLRGYILKHGGGEGLVIRALATLSVYGMVVEPGFDEAGRVMDFVAALTGVTDGLCFLDGDLLDASGASLLARTPTPSALRVAHRAHVLLTVSFRSLLEQDAGGPDESEAEALRLRLASWFEATQGLVAEAEPHELALIQTPIGSAQEQAIIDGVWRAEGAQLLLWALGVRDLPAHDAQEHPYDVAKDVGVLSEGSPEMHASPTLRPADEVDSMRRRLLALHWRLREFRVNPGSVDFEKFAANNWFGGFDLQNIPLSGGDLAIGGKAVGSAAPAAVSIATSNAVERHHAINWLIGAHPLYSRVVTPT